MKHIAGRSKILLQYFSTEQDWHRAWYWKRIYGHVKHFFLWLARRTK